MTEPHVVLVKYSCLGCGLKRVECAVPGRPTDMDIAEWAGPGVLGRALADDHAHRSPACQSRLLAEVMIPTKASGYIGGPQADATGTP